MRTGSLLYLGVLICAVCNVAIGQTADPSTTDTLRFRDIFGPRIERVVALERFYQEGEYRTDLQQATGELMAALAHDGYALQPLPDKRSIRYAEDIPVDACDAEYHLATEDGTLTLNVILFSDEAACRRFWKKRPGRGSSGSNGPAHIAWLMINGADEPGELVAMVRVGPMLVYLDKALPFNVTWELPYRDDYPEGNNLPPQVADRLPGGKFVLDPTEYQQILASLESEMDTFCAIAHLTFKHLVAPADWVWMPEPGEAQPASTSDRVADFIYLWSEVKYNFANFDLVPHVNWDRMRHRYLPLVEQAQSDEQFYRTIQRFLAQLHDGHTSLMTWSLGHCPAISVRPVEGKALITAIGEDPDEATSTLSPGMEIMLVDGRPAEDVIEQDCRPYISASTPQSRDYYAYAYLLAGPRGSTVDITVRDEQGDTHDATLTRSGRWVRKPLLECRDLPGDIAYIALNSFSDQDIVDQFDGIFEEKIRPSKGLIIDVRSNGGGSTSIGNAIIARLIDTPLKGSRYKTRRYLPTLRAWGRDPYGWHSLGQGKVRPRGDSPYLGPVVVLTGPATFSAAEDFLIPLKVSKRATLVGEPTGGSTGQPLVVNLRDGMQARICTKRDTYPDGSDFVGIGVIPDVEVHPTQKDILDGRDRVLEEGIAVLSSVRR